MPDYTYFNEKGVPIVTFVKRQAEKCPVCGSSELKDKGSWSKCLDCGKRIQDSEPRERSQYNSGLGTTFGMWELLSETLAANQEKLPVSLNKAIESLCRGDAMVVAKRDALLVLADREYTLSRRGQNDAEDVTVRWMADCGISSLYDWAEEEGILQEQVEEANENK